MADLKIRVGAAVDRSLSVAFQPLIEAANKAASAVSAAGLKSGQSVGSNTRAGVNAAEKEYQKLGRAAERWQRESVKAAEKASATEARFTERAARDKIRAAEKVTQARQRENEKVVRDAERAEQRASAAAERGAASRARTHERAAATQQRQNSRDLRNGALSLVSGAFGLGKRALGAGIGVAKSAASGMGVDLDYESLVKKGVDLEKHSVDLVNSGYMPGKGGANGQRQSAAEVTSQIRDVSIRTGNDSGDTMHGLQAFVAKTGDLETGRSVLFDLAKLSKATGANMGDMADAAGDVANELGDIPDKGAAIQSVMSAIAAQGKEGAVEIKDLARQMAKLGAAATQFTGSGTQSMANMGALVQMTRAKGGAASSTQAATSVGSFTQTFSKGARRAAFDAAGVKVEGVDGKLRNPRDIIIDALKATGGDTVKMGKMFSDVAARRVTRGFETTYKEAGGGAAGIDAVRKAFDDLAGAVMNNKEVEDSFALAMNTTEAKAKIFNEQLGAIADESRANLLPALQSLAPQILSWSKGLSDWVGRVTGKTAADQSLASDKAEAAAVAANKALNNDLRAGAMKPGDTEQAATARTALEAAIVGQKKKIANESNSMTAEYDKLSPTEARKRADEKAFNGFDAGERAQGKEAQKYLGDQEQLQTMQNTLNDLNQNLQIAMTRALEGSVVTVRLKDPFQIATPSISTPNAGVEPAPGAAP